MTRKAQQVRMLEHGRVIGVIKQTIHQVLQDGGTSDEAVKSGIAAANQVSDLILDKGTADVDMCSDMVLEAAFAPCEAEP